MGRKNELRKIIYKGKGEFFDLSSYPVYREKFSFGNSSIVESGFYITSDCIKCGICFSYCP
ncbi:MAG: 4Fe-4S binding protein [Lachnospiraceae bacterium]|uniref:4Fe-4S binding protein n=1 Tax=Clostridium neonatale TaxID=137838 RepID=UPI001D7A7C5E|nr:4Fe-4S binding protein [Lachnospiraceae bacterium]CAI3621947.1 hypothetical protein CNEO4_1760021 [Clostridium neonatale]CAI3687513.1 hypothetical protein CNEO3_720010 [Clostridium neonatale]CAI3728165.1 hypothetical protein CNEO4_950023 [Clostridium neonatale]